MLKTSWKKLLLWFSFFRWTIEIEWFVSKKWECERQSVRSSHLFVCVSVCDVRARDERSVCWCACVCVRLGGWPLQISFISGTIKSTFMSRPKKAKKEQDVHFGRRLFFWSQQKSKVWVSSQSLIIRFDILSQFFLFFPSKTNFISCAMCSGKRHRLQFTQKSLCSLNYSSCFFIFMVVRTSYAQRKFLKLKKRLRRAWEEAACVFFASQSVQSVAPIRKF